MDYQINDYQDPQNEVSAVLPIEFYYRADNYEYRCVFSTQFGTLPKKQISSALPARIVYSDPLKAVYEKADGLQQQYPEEIWDVVAPTQWEELFHYFDGYDVCLMGVEFLVKVLRNVAERNQWATDQMRQICDFTAVEWVLGHQIMVVDIPFGHDLIQYMHPAELEGLKPREVRMYSEALHKEHGAILDRAIRDKQETANILSHGTVPAQGPLSQIYNTGVLGPGVVPMTAHLPPAAQPPPPQPNDIQRPNIHGLAYNAMNRRMSNEQSRKPSALQPRRNSTNTRSTRAGRNSNMTCRSSPEGHSTLRRYVSTPHGSKTMAPEPQLILAHNPGHVPVQPPSHLGMISGPFVLPQNAPFPMGQHLSQLAHFPQSIQGLQSVANSTLHGSHNSARRQLPSQDARMLPPTDSPTASRNKSYYLDHTQQVSQNHRMVSGSSINEVKLSRTSHPISAIANSTRQISQAFQPFQDNEMPYFPAPGHPGFFDMRALQVGNEHRSPSGCRTLTFNGKKGYENRDDAGECTMLLKYVSVNFAFSVGLKCLLDQLGTVCNITWRGDVLGGGKGCAYVHFETRDTTARAIGFFQNFLPPDGPLTQVMFAPQRKPIPYSYDIAHRLIDTRSHSNNNANHRRNSTNDRNRSRRQSINNQAQIYRPHQYSTQVSRIHSPDRVGGLTNGFDRQLALVHQSMPRVVDQQLISATVDMEYSGEGRQRVQQIQSRVEMGESERRGADDRPPAKVGSSPHKQQSATFVHTSPNRKENIPPYGHKTAFNSKDTTVTNKPVIETTKDEHGNVVNSGAVAALNVDFETQALIVETSHQRKPHDGQKKRQFKMPKSFTSAITTPGSFAQVSDMSESMSATIASSFTSTESAAKLSLQGNRDEPTIKGEEKKSSQMTVQNSILAVTTEEAAKSMDSSSTSEHKGRQKCKKQPIKDSITSLEQKKVNISAPVSEASGSVKSSGGENITSSSTSTQAKKFVNNKKSSFSIPPQEALSGTERAPKLDDKKEFPTLERSKSSVSLIADGKRPDPPTVSTPTNGSPASKSRPSKTNNSKKSGKGGGHGNAVDAKS